MGRAGTGSADMGTDGWWVALCEQDIVLAQLPSVARRRIRGGLAEVPLEADSVYLEYCLDDCSQVKFPPPGRHTYGRMKAQTHKDKYMDEGVLEERRDAEGEPFVSTAYAPRCGRVVLFSRRGLRKLQMLLHYVDTPIEQLLAHRYAHTQTHCHTHTHILRISVSRESGSRPVAGAGSVGGRGEGVGVEGRGCKQLGGGAPTQERWCSVGVFCPPDSLPLCMSPTHPTAPSDAATRPSIVSNSGVRYSRRTRACRARKPSNSISGASKPPNSISSLGTKRPRPRPRTSRATVYCPTTKICLHSRTPRATSIPSVFDFRRDI
jgi:hypothetical protein